MTKTNIPGRRKQPAAFRRTFKDYTTESILSDESHWSEKDLRKAYSELRSVARKRLIRLKQAGLEESSLFKNNESKFKPLEEVKDRSELQDLVSDVARFVNNDLTKVSKMKPWIEKNIKSIKNLSGREFTTEEFLLYDRFMKVILSDFNYWKDRKKHSQEVFDRMVQNSKNRVQKRMTKNKSK